MNNVVIVESPSKAKTINKYLGKDYQVFASYGHIRDLPSKNGSVDPDDDFAMKWEADPKSAKRLAEIAKAVKGADKLILATDPDREGEAISWHVLDVLKQKKALKDQPVERVVFNQITKSAVTEAMASPRQIDQELVDAYMARRALDYLVGFTLSPVLWRKLPGAKSAGRVQSVSLRLIVDREMEIEAFKAQEYWSITTSITTPRNDTFEARLVRVDGKTLKKLDIGNETEASRLVDAVKTGNFSVTSVEAKPTRRNPSPPFMTSTLQQEASRKLGFSATRTMQVAQRLYEGIDIGGETVGLITYMRTDGMDLAPEAIGELREYIGGEYGAAYVPESPRLYKSKAKNAQEAHEAIRPTSAARTPSSLNLESDQARLYELIWKRTVSCQMATAILERTTIDMDANNVGLRATGTVVTFDGFLRVYEEGRDEKKDDDENRRLPKVNQGEAVDVSDVAPAQHFTEPPPRFSEASLVKRMEELGIGRPSTYASILQVLQDRSYVVYENKRFKPEDKGRLVTTFLESFFTRFVEFDFTAALEEKLDLVSDGKLDWKTLMSEFWVDFKAHVDGTAELRITQVLDKLNDVLGPHIFPDAGDGTDPRKCPACADGRLSLKTSSKFGAFIGCANYPECRFTKQMGAGDGDDAARATAAGPKVLGTSPDGIEVTLRSGRFGAYLQLGEPEGKEKPKRGPIPKSWSVDDVDLEKALKLLALPREIGLHPEDGEPIQASFGPYGPYVRHLKTYANIESDDEVFDIGLNRAVTLIAEKREKGGKGRFGSAKPPLKDLGVHPEDGEKIVVLDGRFGPYVKHGKTNATVPKNKDPQSVTLDEALVLIAERIAKTGKAPAKKKAAPKKKPAAKKKAPAKKKPAAKKAPAAE